MLVLWETDALTVSGKRLKNQSGEVMDAMFSALGCPLEEVSAMRNRLHLLRQQLSCQMD